MRCKHSDIQARRHARTEVEFEAVVHAERSTFAYNLANRTDSVRCSTQRDTPTSSDGKLELSSHFHELERYERVNTVISEEAMLGTYVRS